MSSVLWRVKMNKAKQLREMTSDQLTHELSEARKELLDQTVRASASQEDTGPGKVVLRRQVARILTILHEREEPVAAAEEVAPTEATA
jgi:ribosomal protein L29